MYRVNRFGGGRLALRCSCLHLRYGWSLPHLLEVWEKRHDDDEEMRRLFKLQQIFWLSLVRVRPLEVSAAGLGYWLGDEKDTDLPLDGPSSIERMLGTYAL